MKPQHVCCCEELGCRAESFQLDGVLHQGKLRNKQNGANHENQLRRLRLTRAAENQSATSKAPQGSQAYESSVHSNTQIVGRRRSLSTGDLGAVRLQSSSIRQNEEVHPQVTNVPGMRRRRSSSQTVRGTNEAILLDHQHVFRTVSTEAYQIPQVYLQRPSCLIGMLQVTHASLVKGVKHRTCRNLLHMNKRLIEQTAKDINYTGRPYWENLPLTLSTLYTMLNLDIRLETQISCPECFTLHGAPAEKVDDTCKTKCDALRFLRDPDAPRGAPVTRHPCGRALYSGLEPKPERKFHYHSLQTWLARMLNIPGFEADLDAPLEHQYDGETMRDIWDGQIWQSFEHSGKRFTSKSGNLVFGLFVDWFNPHGRGARKARSHGIILLVCFNLPPNKRYKQENLFLFGVIPGPTEPALEQTNELLKPLVAEFQELWNGIFLTSTSDHPKGRVIRAALWPLIADLPAMRKVAGFASHSAKHFCAHCDLFLKQRHILDSDQWPQRFNHQQHAEEWRDALTEKNQEDLFSAYGVQYSVLSELPYWRPIEFVTIDVMHCLLLGTLKDHANSFIGIGEAGKKLKAKLDRKAHLNIGNCVIPRDFPSSNVNSGTSNLADSENTGSEEDSSMNVEELSEINENVPMDWSINVDKFNSQSSVLEEASLPEIRPSSSRRMQPQTPIELSRKRGRSRGTSSQMNNAKRAKVSTSITTPASEAEESNILPSSQIDSQGTSGSIPSSEYISVPSSEDRNSRRPLPRRSKQIQSQSTSRITTVDTPVMKVNAGRLRSNSNTTVRASTKTSNGKGKQRATAAAPKPSNPEDDRPDPQNNNPSLTMHDLIDIRDAISTAKTPSWMTRPPIKIGIPKSGIPSAMEWLTFYTVYMVLTIIPKLYFSKDAKDQALCQSLIYLVEITNCALSRTLTQKDKEDLQQLVHSYRAHLGSFWKGVSVKPNLHFLQHLVEVAERFGPPPYTATMAGERVIGMLSKVSKNYHTDDMDKTMTQTYNRRALFKAVLNGCPTFLHRVDTKIREELIQELTETPKTRWSKSSSLNCDTYDIWLNYLNSDLVQRYGEFSKPSSIPVCSPTLPTNVETTKLLKIYGKNYTSNQAAKGKGNSAIEYRLQGQRCFGYIQYAFRTKLVPTVFLVVDEFTQLNASDSTKDCYASHPRLHAARVYSKISRSVVVDVQDLIGHVVVLPYQPGHLGIEQETLGIIGLRNIISIDADSTSEW